VRDPDNLRRKGSRTRSGMLKGRRPLADQGSESPPRLETHPALFIYIPTYNRLSTLRKQLDAVTSQRGDWPGQVRILVNDNASPSFSTEAAASMAREYGVEVRSNLGNVDGNANIALGFVFARPEEYLWILSDDDIVCEGALQAIATHGLVGDPDVVSFGVTSGQPATLVPTWRVGCWDWVSGSAGQISNVIYKAQVFAAQASQAFFYHNSSYPHLAVLMATIRERGSLRFRVVPRAWVLQPPALHGEEQADYSWSLSGMPQLAPLMPPGDAGRFCRGWLREYGPGFIKYKDKHPEVHLATRAVLKKYGGRRAMIRLRWLILVQSFLSGLRRSPLAHGRVTRLLPKTIRQRLRAYLYL
jgi:glycosyltransferase involved in cell wall biosynthesis